MEPSKRLEPSKRAKNCGQPVIQYDQYRLSKTEWFLAAGKGILLWTLVAYTFYRSFFIWLILMPAGFLYPVYEKRRLKKQRFETLAWEFQESALLLAASLSAGYSIENAFSVSLRELELLYGGKGLMLREMEYMEAQIRNNCPAEQVLTEFGLRSSLEDIKNFAQVFSAAKRSGGQLAEILRNTAEIFREKAKMREEIRTLTAAKQFEQRIMNLLPFLLIWYMDLTSPGFLDLMYETVPGRVVMTVCLLVYLAAFMMAEMILNFKF